MKMKFNSYSTQKHNRKLLAIATEFLMKSDMVPAF